MCVCVHMCVCVSGGSSEKREGKKAERESTRRMQPLLQEMLAVSPGAALAMPSGAARSGPAAVSCRDVVGGVTRAEKGKNTQQRQWSWYYFLEWLKRFRPKRARGKLCARRREESEIQGFLAADTGRT